MKHLRKFVDGIQTPWKKKAFTTLLWSLPMIAYLVVYLIWWAVLETHESETGYSVIHTPVDDLIPFNEYFVIPYLFWFFYMTYVLIYFLIKCDRTEYAKLLAFLGLGMTLFLIVSTVFPNALQLRPAHFSRDNMFTRLVAFVYRHDTPTNVFPSIHVYNSIGCHLAVSHSPVFSKKTRLMSFIVSTSIVMSTMFIKQHSVFDVMCAFALCVIFDYFVYYTPFVKKIVRGVKSRRYT